MDQTQFSLPNATGASEDKPAPTHRRARPLTRTQEIAVLEVVFAIGAALQIAYVLHGAATQ